MQLIFEKNDLLKATRLLQEVAARATEMPVLSYILINAQQDKIQMQATNLEISLKMQVNGTIIESGSVTILARKLFDFVVQLPPSVVKLNKTVNERVVIECERGRYRMIGLPVNQFPRVAEMPDYFFTLQTETFKDALAKTAFATSKEEKSYSLNGVYLHLTKSATTLVAADGKKLAKVEIPKLDNESYLCLIAPMRQH